MNRLPLCAAGTSSSCRSEISNKNSESRVSSQATWDLYCAAVEEVARMSINKEPYHSRRSTAAFAVKNHPDNVTSYYNHHKSLSYQKLQAIQFQQLKQHQLMKHQSRGVRLNSNKNIGPVDLSSSAWSNQHPRRDVMRAVFIGDHTGRRSSTGTGVFLPRRVNHTSSEVQKRIPAEVAQVVEEPGLSSASINGVAWRQRNNNSGFLSQTHGGLRAELTVNEPRLPTDWAY